MNESASILRTILRLGACAVLGLVCVYLQRCDLFAPKEPRPKTELEKLPPATQEGKQTFGCLVNGKAWVPKSSIDAIAVYQSGTLDISGEDTEFDFQQIGMILTENGTAFTSGEYDLASSVI